MESEKVGYAPTLGIRNVGRNLGIITRDGLDISHALDYREVAEPIVRAVNTQDDLVYMLNEISDELKRRFDTVDARDGSPAPNWAMNLDAQIQEVLRKAESSR